MTPLDRRIALMKAEIKPVDIATAAKVSRATVSKVLDGLTTSDRIQRLIAKAISKPVEEVFPARYTKQSRRKKALERLSA